MSWLRTGQIIIGKIDTDHVSISVIDRSKDWIDGTVQISAGAWSGTCRASFYEGELRQFASEIERLYKDLEGFAQLCPIEPHLELKLEGDGKGHVLVDGKAQHRLSVGTYLTFRLEIDQTELPAIISGLRLADPD